MKNITYLLGLILVLGVISSCTKEEDENPFASIEPQGAVVSVGNLQSDFFNLTDPDNAGVTFDLTTKGETVNSVTLLQSTKGAAPVELTTVSSFPATVSVSLADIMASSGLTIDDLAPGDQTVFSFANVGTPSGTYPSGSSLTILMACPSDLAGTYSYSSSNMFCDGTMEGEVELIANGGGVYTFNDWSFGAYPLCYDGFVAESWGTLTFTDECGEVFFSGDTDNYGDTWTFSSSLEGTEWTITWENTYGERGTTVLTNPDGWPFVLR